MPTIYYETFPASSPAPVSCLPDDHDHDITIMSQSFTLASSSSLKTNTLSNGSPTSVIGQMIPPPRHSRDNSLKGFLLQPGPRTSSSSTTAAPTSTTTTSAFPSTKKRKYDNYDVYDDEWICPISAKAQRTKSCLQDSIRPIASKIQMGFQRIDRKDPISLAVSVRMC